MCRHVSALVVDYGTMTMLLRLSAVSVIVGAALLTPTDARADYLVLTNGDRLTGTIQSESPAEFVVMTELAGRVLLLFGRPLRRAGQRAEHP